MSSREGQIQAKQLFYLNMSLRRENYKLYVVY